MVVKDVAVCGKRHHLDERLIIGKRKGIKDAVVSLTGIQGGKSLATLGSNFVIGQKDCAYEPHMLLVPVHAQVQILNDDQVLHNIHTFSKVNPPMNLAQPKFKRKLEVSFSEPEKIPVRCDIHAWMNTWIVVVDHPYHALTDEEGNFMLEGVPPGTYTLTCWQELLGEQSREVTISEGSDLKVEFEYEELERRS